MVASQNSEETDDESRHVRQLLEQLRAVLRRVEGIPVSAYEELDGDALSPLQTETRDALTASINVVEQLLDHVDAVAEQRASRRGVQLVAQRRGELCGDVERAMQQDIGTRRIQNVGFIARLGLPAFAPSMAWARRPRSGTSSASRAPRCARS